MRASFLFGRMRVLAMKGLVVALVLMGVAQQALASAERFAFSINDFDASLASYTIDANSGNLRFLRYYPIGKAASAVAVDPSGQFVIATSQSIDRVFVFRINRQTGNLQAVPGSPFAVGGRAPFQVDFHPSGRFLYIAHRFAGVGAYTFDATTGTITPLAGSPFRAGNRVRSVVVTPSGRHLYAMNAHDDSLSVFRINAQTGSLQILPELTTDISDEKGIDYLAQDIQEIPSTAGGLPYHMTRDPAGRFLFVTNVASANISVFAIDDDSGAVKEVDGSPFFTGFNPYSATVDPSGKRLNVVLIREHKIAVHNIDADTGRLTPVPGSPFATGGERPTEIVFSRDGKRAYANNRQSNDISQLAVDTQTGALSVVEVVKTRTAPWGLALADGDPPQWFPPRLLATQAASTSAANSATGPKGALVMFSDKLKPLANAPSDGQPVAAVVRADGAFVYVLNADAGSVTTFRVTADGSGMQAIGSIAVGKAPNAIATGVNGWYLYITNHADKTMSVLYIDPDTGLPKAVRGSPVATGQDPVAVTLDPASRYAFVVNQGSNNISVYRYRTNVTPLYFESVMHGSPFAAGKEPVDLAVDPSGRYAYVANAGENTISAYRIHHETGALSALPGSPFKAGQRPLALAAHPNGRFLLVANRDSRDISLFRIETALGAIAPVGKTLKLPRTPKGLWLSAQGNEGYALSSDGLTLMRFSFAAETGAMRLLGSKKLSAPLTDLLPVSRL